jgi:hypothetical protein
LFGGDGLLFFTRGVGVEQGKSRPTIPTSFGIS